MEHILSTRVLLAVLNGLEAEARGGAPVCLAIVNCGGGLAALLTMGGTPERAVSIAQGKAYTALNVTADESVMVDGTIDMSKANAIAFDP